MLGRDYCDANRDHDWRREDDNGNIVDNVVYHWYRGKRYVKAICRRCGETTEWGEARAS